MEKFFILSLEINLTYLHINNQFEELTGLAGLPSF
jgi:hypothetical protein